MPKARAADEESYSYEDEDWVQAKSGCRSATLKTRPATDGLDHWDLEISPQQNKKGA